MSLNYLVKIENPSHSIVEVNLSLRLEFLEKMSSSSLEWFLPSWTPGSYLMREYPRYVQRMEAVNAVGEKLPVLKTDKGTWEIDLESSKDLLAAGDSISINYRVYAHELGVRNSFIDDSHAFLHGPAYLIGVARLESLKHQIEFRFPPAWSKFTSSLIDISDVREKFIYSAENYDILLDSPVEIGCHETDGFHLRDRNHFLGFYGHSVKSVSALKPDIQTIFEEVASWFPGDLPYPSYTVITHFLAENYGGLEHLDSTVLAFDGRKLNQREEYISWLGLVAHEYFHVWNGKRIRPEELGPFDYRRENQSVLLWLVEGLTCFFDDFCLLRAGLITAEEYFKIQIKNLNALENIPGRFEDSLEQSSYDAWIKLYRPQENSVNSTVSYYLKGGLVWFWLQCRLVEQGNHLLELLPALWSFYQKRPGEGINRDELLELMTNLWVHPGSHRNLNSDSKLDLIQEFSSLVETTIEPDWQSSFDRIGLGLQREAAGDVNIAWGAKFEGCVVKHVIRDKNAFRGGIMPGDEILAIDGQRVKAEEIQEIGKWCRPEQVLEVLVARNRRLVTVPVLMSKSTPAFSEIIIRDEKKWSSFLGKES